MKVLKVFPKSGSEVVGISMADIFFGGFRRIGPGKYIVLRPYRDRTTEKYLTVMIRREAFDPNRPHKLLPERAFA